MAELIVRDTAPTVSNPRYRNIGYGGYNRCIVRNPDTGFVLPNCVGYAWGRFLEANNLTDCRLSTGNASSWWYNTGDGYQRGNTPRIGAVGCYGGGNYGGAGHVLFVEKINEDGTILCSESNYGGEVFQMRTLGPDAALGWGLIFQGFIYSPTLFDGSEGGEIPIDPNPPYDPRRYFKWWLSKRVIDYKKGRKI